MITENKRMGLRRDPKLYQAIVAIFERSRDNIKDKGIFKDAETYKKVYDNEPWGTLPKMERPDHLSKLKIPVASSYIETGLSVATARPPRPTIEPEIDPAKVNQLIAALPVVEGESPPDENEIVAGIQKEASVFADGMSKELVKHWHEANMQYIIREVYRQKAIVGEWFLKTHFDQREKVKKEQICGITEIFPSPGVNTIVEHSGEPFIHAPIITARQARREFDIDGFEDGAINSNAGLRKEQNLESGLTFVIPHLISAGKALINRFTGKSITEDNGFVMPLYCYMPADDTDFIEEEDTKPVVEAGEVKVSLEKDAVETETVMVQRDKFPSGYKCVTIIFGHKDWIVSEEDCPYAPYGKPQPPFVAMHNSKPFDSFWGVSDIKRVGDLISQICLSASNLNDVLRFTGNAPLILPKDAIRAGEDATTVGENDPDDEALVAQTGEIWRTSGKPFFLEPPGVGFDVKWWIEWLLKMCDLELHQSDALRGFNKFSQDSGKKVRELRAAAMGTFGPKLDEVVEFCNEVYRMWAWIDINMLSDKVVYQKQQTEMGKDNFSKFTPSAGKMFKFFISTSQRALLPDDPQDTFDQTVGLYQMDIRPTSVIPPEMLIENSMLEDKQPALKWIGERQAQMQENVQKQQTFEQFKQLATASSQAQPRTPEEEQLFMELGKILQAMPEIVSTPEFQALSSRLKTALAAEYSKVIIGQPEQPTQGGGNSVTSRTS